MFNIICLLRRLGGSFNSAWFDNLLHPDNPYN